MVGDEHCGADTSGAGREHRGPEPVDVEGVVFIELGAGQECSDESQMTSAGRRLVSVWASSPTSARVHARAEYGK